MVQDRFKSALAFGSLVSALVLVSACSGSSDGDGSSGSGGTSGSGGSAGSTNTDAGSDAGCAAIDNRVPVSCEPFAANTTCNPFGTWSLTYDDPIASCILAHEDLVVELGSDGIARVGFGETTSATLSEDGCELHAISSMDVEPPGESGSIVETLTLTFANGASATATGKLEYGGTGFCLDSGETTATAAKLD